MVKGLDVFRERFSDYSNQYVLIGGVASHLVMSDAGLNFRKTKDLDIVLIVEMLNEDFGTVFWNFIQDGGYRIQKQSDGTPKFYRFDKPTNPSYPFMIEIFSRRDDKIFTKIDGVVDKVFVADGISSLSAILLDEEYYNLLLSSNREIDGIRILDESSLIPFKAKAFLDLSENQVKGIKQKSYDILKHKEDVFILQQLLISGREVELPQRVADDMRTFIEKMRDEEIDLKKLNIEGSKDEILADLAAYYTIDELIFQVL